VAYYETTKLHYVNELSWWIKDKHLKKN
jgi:hypothetical protein